MIVGSLELQIRMDGCFSLKDKRRVLQRILTRARHDFHVAASEVGDHELWNVATIGFAAVGNNRLQVESLLRRIEAVVESDPEIILEQSALSFPTVEECS